MRFFFIILLITVQRPAMAFVKLIQLSSCFGVFFFTECVTHTVNEPGVIILEISQRFSVCQTVWNSCETIIFIIGDNCR